MKPKRYYPRRRVNTKLSPEAEKLLAHFQEQTKSGKPNTVNLITAIKFIGGKQLYDVIKELRGKGYVIYEKPGKKGGYYLAERQVIFHDSIPKEQ